MLTRIEMETTIQEALIYNMLKVVGCTNRQQSRLNLGLIDTHWQGQLEGLHFYPP